MIDQVEFPSAKEEKLQRWHFWLPDRLTTVTGQEKDLEVKRIDSNMPLETPSPTRIVRNN